MTNSFLNKLKVRTKRLLGHTVYSYVYINRKLKNIKLLYLSKDTAKKHKKSIKSVTLKHWRLAIMIICLSIGSYYGIGAAISSKINNNLQKEYAFPQKSKQKTLYALAYVIKMQVDDQAWTPALPIFFPASVLDNLPSFQLGVKETANFYIKKLARLYQNEDLKKAGKLLDYKPDIWLFSQTAQNKLTPGSAKQYRNALAIIEKVAKKELSQKQPSTEDLLYILKNTDKILSKKINQLDKHIHEHSSEILDFSADNVFYNTLGAAYTLHYVLSAVAKDYQLQIVASEQYENITTALHFLENATKLKPLTVKNAAATEIYEANHLYYLAYYLSRAQYYIQEIFYGISAENTSEQQHEN